MFGWRPLMEPGVKVPPWEPPDFAALLDELDVTLIPGLHDALVRRPVRADAAAVDRARAAAVHDRRPADVGTGRGGPHLPDQGPPGRRQLGPLPQPGARLRHQRRRAAAGQLRHRTVPRRVALRLPGRRPVRPRTRRRVGAGRADRPGAAADPGADAADAVRARCGAACRGTADGARAALRRQRARVVGAATGDDVHARRQLRRGARRRRRTRGAPADGTPPERRSSPDRPGAGEVRRRRGARVPHRPALRDRPRPGRAVDALRRRHAGPVRPVEQLEGDRPRRHAAGTRTATHRGRHPRPAGAHGGSAGQQAVHGQPHRRPHVGLDRSRTRHDHACRSPVRRRRARCRSPVVEPRRTHSSARSGACSRASSSTSPTAPGSPTWRPWTASSRPTSSTSTPRGRSSSPLDRPSRRGSAATGCASPGSPSTSRRRRMSASPCGSRAANAWPPGGSRRRSGRSSRSPRTPSRRRQHERLPDRAARQHARRRRAQPRPAVVAGRGRHRRLLRVRGRRVHAARRVGPARARPRPLTVGTLRRDPRPLPHRPRAPAVPAPLVARRHHE